MEILKMECSHDPFTLHLLKDRFYSQCWKEFSFSLPSLGFSDSTRKDRHNSWDLNLKLPHFRNTISHWSCALVVHVLPPKVASLKCVRDAGKVRVTLPQDIWWILGKNSKHEGGKHLSCDPQGFWNHFLGGIRAKGFVGFHWPWNQTTEPCEAET